MNEEEVPGGNPLVLPGGAPPVLPGGAPPVEEGNNPLEQEAGAQPGAALPIPPGAPDLEAGVNPLQVQLNALAAQIATLIQQMPAPAPVPQVPNPILAPGAGMVAQGMDMLRVSHPELMTHLGKRLDKGDHQTPIDWTKAQALSDFKRKFQSTCRSYFASDIYDHMEEFANEANKPVFKFPVTTEPAFNSRLNTMFEQMLPEPMMYLIKSDVEQTYREIVRAKGGGDGVSLQGSWLQFTRLKTLLNSPDYADHEQASKALGKLNLSLECLRAFEYLLILGKQDPFFPGQLIRPGNYSLDMDDVRGAWDLHVEMQKSTKGFLASQSMGGQPVESTAPSTPTTLMAATSQKNNRGRRGNHDPSLCIRCGGPKTSCPDQGRDVWFCTKVKPTDKCGKCKKPGHSQNYCLTSQKNLTINYFSSSPQQNQVEHVQVLDSGCGHSASSDTTKFVSFSSSHSLPSYQGINGTVQPTAAGQCLVELPTTEGSKSSVALPTRVLPSLPANTTIVAASGLEDAGFSTHILSAQAHACSKAMGLQVPRRYLESDEGQIVKVHRQQGVYLLGENRFHMFLDEDDDDSYDEDDDDSYNKSSSLVATTTSAAKPLSVSRAKRIRRAKNKACSSYPTAHDQDQEVISRSSLMSEEEISALAADMDSGSKAAMAGEQRNFSSPALLGVATAAMTFDETHMITHCGHNKLAKVIARDKIAIQGRRQLSSSCAACAQAKLTRSDARSLRSTEHAWEGPMASMDATGTKTRSQRGNTVAIQVLDESGKVFVHCCPTLDSQAAIDAIQHYIRDRWLGVAPAKFLLRMDDASQFHRSESFNKHILSLLWTPRVAPADEHAFNGAVEHSIGTITNLSSAFLHASNVGVKYWDYAYEHAANIHSRLPGTTGKSPNSILGLETSLKGFYPFGCGCYYRVTSRSKRDFAPKATPGVYLGRAPHYSFATHLIMDMATKRLHRVRAAVFFPSFFPDVSQPVAFPLGTNTPELQHIAELDALSPSEVQVGTTGLGLELGHR